MTRTLRDVLIMGGAFAAAVIAAAILRRFLDARWEGALVVFALFAAAAIVKWRWPSHVALGDISWLYFALTFAIFQTIALLFSDWGIVGAYWTIPAAVGLGLLFCVVHLVFGPRGDDDRRSSG